MVIADWDADALEQAVSSLADAGSRPDANRRARPVDHRRHDRAAPGQRPRRGRQRRQGGPRPRSTASSPAHGRIDIVFANAGIARGRPPLLPEGWLDDMDMAAYNALIDVNLHGVVYTVQAAARHMKRQRSGSIVTTASTAGLRNDPYTPYSYAIAKAAVVNFTKQAAHDLARWGVRVNAIAPGPFKTHLGGKEPTSAEADAMWSAVVPLGRMGDPKEIRGLALLLASDAGSFMTGGIYPIDGGALLQGPPSRPSTRRERAR